MTPNSTANVPSLPGSDRRPLQRHPPPGVPHQVPAPDPTDGNLSLLLAHRRRPQGLGDGAGHAEVGGVGLGKEDGHEGQARRAHRLRPIQAPEGQVRKEQDRRQGRQHQEEEARQGQQTLKNTCFLVTVK